jgi:hypothetical protein
MNDASDDRFRRLFATAPEVGPDESFVEAMRVGVAARRRRRQAGILALWMAAVATLSVLLAPYAPVEEVSRAGSSLLQLPEMAARVMQQRAGAVYSGIQLPAYLYFVLAGGILPLAATAWLLRRS